MGRAMWQVIGVLAELERSLISERTRSRVKAAQRKGVKFGRKVKLTPEQIDLILEINRQRRSPPVRGRQFERGPLNAYRALAG
jgi:DNA invertase Pin-like site-specific DNA recombinase